MKIVIICGLLLLGLLASAGGRAPTWPSSEDQKLIAIVQKQAEERAVQSRQMAELQTQISGERSRLDEQRDRLEQERQAIGQAGLLVLEMLPLALCLAMLHRSEQPGGEELIAETLIQDLMSSAGVLTLPVETASPPRVLDLRGGPAERGGTLA